MFARKYSTRDVRQVRGRGLVLALEIGCSLTAAVLNLQVRCIGDRDKECKMDGSVAVCQSTMVCGVGSTRCISYLRTAALANQGTSNAKQAPTRAELEQLL